MGPFSFERVEQVTLSRCARAGAPGASCGLSGRPGVEIVEDGAHCGGERVGDLPRRLSGGRLSSDLVGDCLNHPGERDRMNLGNRKGGAAGSAGENGGDSIGVPVGHLQGKPAYRRATDREVAEPAAHLGVVHRA